MRGVALKLFQSQHSLAIETLSVKTPKENEISYLERLIFVFSEMTACY